MRLATPLLLALSACSSGAAALAPEPAPPAVAAPAVLASAPSSSTAPPVERDERGAPAAGATAEASAGPVVPARPPLPKGTVVLHVGDSFVHSGLTQTLRGKLEPLGVRYEVRAEKSTNSLDWAGRVPELVSATQPDLVIVTLGGNEIGSKHLDVQGRAVARIVKAIGGRPCVWTTPPLWRREEGLFDAVQANVAPCRFFETDVVVGRFLPRREDKIHPTPEGGAMWADALFAWLERERTGEGRPWALRPSPEAELEPRGMRDALPH